MAEQANTAAIVPASTPLEGDYIIDIKEFDAAGKSSLFRVPVPTTLNSQEASIMIRAAILKKTTWKTSDIPTIIHAIMYSDRMGLDIVAGDVYTSPDGRIATTSGAKIRHAMNSGKIGGYKVDITEGPQITLKYTLKGEQQEYKGPNLKATVSVSVKGWAEPVTYETTLAEWFMGANPNWRTRPAYMLRRNALSKAFEEVAPMGLSPEEAPPLE